MNQTIINKVPHAVYILDDNNNILRVFPKSNGMIRVEEESHDIGEIDGIHICSTIWGDTTDVPDPQDGVYYIVSQLVKNALPERPDLLVPKHVVRDDNGNIIGCRRLDLGNFKITKLN
jgi:hypothetical protein